MPPVYNTASVTGAAGFRDATNNELQDWLIKIAENTTAMRESMQNAETRGDREKRDREREEPAWARKLGDRIERGLNTAVSTALNQARSLAARGMSGTLEQAQQDYAMQQLGRQFAAVMMPITQAFTYLAGQIERRMSAMGGTEQNRMFGALAGGLAGWKLGGGPFSALAGAALGSAFMGGNGASGTGAGIAGGAYAGFRVAGAPGAVVGGATAAMFAPPSENRGEKPSEYYDRMKAGGANRLDATLATGGRAMLKAFSDLTNVGLAFKAFDAPLATAANAGMMARSAGATKGSDGRRDVTPFSADMTEAGGQYFELQKAMIRATAGEGTEEAGPLKSLMDLLLQIYDVLAAILAQSGGEIPKPRSAEAARGP